MSELADLDHPADSNSWATAVRPTKRALSRWLVVGIVLSMVLVGLYVVPIAVVFLDGYSRSGVEPVPFSSKDWRELGRPRFLPGQVKRRHMAEDLLANHHLENMSRAEILDLLGPPDPGGFHSRDSVPYIFSYYLGPGMVEDLWLVLQFDVEDLVIDASITHD